MHYFNGIATKDEPSAVIPTVTEESRDNRAGLFDFAHDGTLFDAERNGCELYSFIFNLNSVIYRL